MLEKTDIFQTCQMPINLADMSYQSFIKGVLPKLIERNIGALAMKTLANGGFFGGETHGQHGDNPKVVPNRVSVAEAIHFVWSLPISTLITGPDNVEMIKEKMALARSFIALDEKKREALVAKVADMAGRRVEFYKA
jgi:aryl-alcohol dehydrogenase-like predicted oxidoreductase